MSKFDTAKNLTKVAMATARAKWSPGEDSRQRAHQALATWMADARGVPTKIGQFLAGNDEDSLFQPLLETLTPLELEPMLEHLTEKLGHPWEETFTQIEPSQAAASLGQVHRATLHDGTPVALKIQYPHIAKNVHQEMKVLGLLPEMGPVKKWGFDLAGYKQNFFDSLERELNYSLEAEQQTRFHDATAVPGLVVPRIFPSVDSKSILVQEWQEGLPLSSALQWPADQRRQLAKTIMQTFWYSAFHTGHLHGDPHLGNVKARVNISSGEPEWIVMDYGCMLEVPEEVRLALLHLILGTVAQREIDPLACFIAMGFDGDKLASIANQLPALCTVLFEPFAQNERVYNTQYWNLATRIDGVLGELKWWFRSAGPPNLFLFMRAFSGLLNHLDSINIALNWSEELRAIVPPDTLKKAECYVPPPVPQSMIRTTTGYHSMAQYLKVRVMENGKQVVNVTMPAIQVSQLDTLMPEDTLASIEQSGIDVAAIAQAACVSGITPQKLFSHEQGDRIYTVWLE